MIPLFASEPVPGAKPALVLFMPVTDWAPILWLVVLLLSAASFALTLGSRPRPWFTVGCCACAVLHPFLWIDPDRGDLGYFQCGASWFVLLIPFTLLLIQLVLPAPQRYRGEPTAL